MIYGPVRNAFDAGSIHYEGKWEGVGPWKLSAIWDPKNSFSGPNPLPIAKVMDAARIISITQGPYKS